MADELYTRTNQALAFARLALGEWHQAAAATEIGAATRVAYHREHTVFHLYRGLLWLIQEVADGYRWTLTGTQSVEQLLRAEQIERFPGPELAELAQLRQRSDSWVAGILSAWQQLQAPPARAGAAGALIVGGAATPPWGLAEAEEALASLRAQVERYRQNLQEW
ncbi:DUF6586 family protein [Halopseudomonas sp. Lyrl_26]|uniref:DUF6586 family protein n=1 Tax=Halopseudomonas sp. Lyrl_26 TaxID=3110923 RepID=UPI003F81A05E